MRMLARMKLYVCYTTRELHLRPGGHPCRLAYDALRDAGHDPEIVKTYGWGPLPDITGGRKEVKRLTGQSWVPALTLDDGETIHDSKRIIAWAEANPA